MSTQPEEPKTDTAAAVGSSDLLADELASLKTQNTRLREALRECHSEWYRLRDFIGTESSEEMCRFMDAVRECEGKGKGVHVFQNYLARLWNERNKLKSEKPSNNCIGAPWRQGRVWN